MPSGVLISAQYFRAKWTSKETPRAAIEGCEQTMNEGPPPDSEPPVYMGRCENINAQPGKPGCSR